MTAWQGELWPYDPAKACHRPVRPRGFYVYALIDPRDQRPFYVGKGKGWRCLQHLKDFKNGCEKNRLKHAYMADIVKAGAAPLVQILQEGMTEIAALHLEGELIRRFRPALVNYHRSGSPQVRDLARVRLKAQNMLSQAMPFCRWVTASPRSKSDASMYGFVMENLRALASWGAPT